MSTSTSARKHRRKSKSETKEKTGFNLEISTDAQIAFLKGIILGLVVISMVILACFKIFEPVVWSSLMTLAGYVAFANIKSNANEQNNK